MLSLLKKELKALYHDEQGAEMMEYVLVVAAIALPLLGVVIWFWKDLVRWVNSLWGNAQNKQGTDPSSVTN